MNFKKKKMSESEKELLEEKETAFQFLKIE